MKPYVLRLVKTGFPDEIIPYLSINQEKRKKLKNELENNHAHLYCNCIYPQELEMHFSTEDKIIPMHYHYPHADSCPKSDLAKQMAIYNKTFTYKDDEQKDIIVNVSLDFSKKKRREVTGATHQTDRAPIINHKMTVTAMIKKINMSAFQNMTFSANAAHYVSSEEFLGWIKWKTKHVYVTADKTLYDLSFKEDNKKFFYGEYVGCREITDTYILFEANMCYSVKDENSGKIVDKIGLCKMSFKKDDIEMAFEEFAKTYNGMSVDSAINQGYRIICSGFYTKDGKYNKCLDVHFILVSQNGLFAESKYEADMYDYICDYLNSNNLKSQYAFYKPWEFGDSIYQNNYLEDGIIYDRKNDKTFYVEVFGMNTPKYLETKAHKEKIADDKLIKWNAALKEVKPELNDFFSK